MSKLMRYRISNGRKILQIAEPWRVHFSSGVVEYRPYRDVDLCGLETVESIKVECNVCKYEQNASSLSDECAYCRTEDQTLVSIDSKFWGLKPSQGNYIQLSSDDWRVFDSGSWREMTIEEQIEASK